MAEQKKVEVLVIGAGPGGYAAAIRAAQYGKKTLCVDKGELGGVCLNVGCIPSKALIHAAKVVRQIREAAEMGITTSEPKVDPKKLQEWKSGVVNQLTGGIGQLFKANGVDHLKGEAKFTGKDKVLVKGEKGDVEVTFDACILATGSRTIEIPGFKYDHDFIIDSTDALELTKVPKDFVVIGGGFIGLEIGGVYEALGSKVTVVEMMDQILPGQDPEIVRTLARSLKKQGIKTLTKAKAKSADKKKGEVVVELDGGKTETLKADAVLVSVGRRPNTDVVDLEKAGIELDERKYVKIDKQLRTSNPKVYAIGDIVPGPALAHKSTKEGLTAAAVIAGKNVELDYRALPWAVFTDPEIATVGLGEQQAKDAGYTPVVSKFPFAASGRARSTNETDGFVKIVADKDTDLLLGVHIIGAEASNLIAEAALAIEMGAVAEDLALTIHTHPTFPETLMEAAEGVHGKMIHAVNR